MKPEINALKYCPHKHTRPKLVAWATDTKGIHEQGFKIENCCIDCGTVVLPVEKRSIKRPEVFAILYGQEGDIT